MKLRAHAIWKSVKAQPNFNKVAEFTLVRVKGWTRSGFACWDSMRKRWVLHPDPAVEPHIKDNAVITHWLQIQK